MKQDAPPNYSFVYLQNFNEKKRHILKLFRMAGLWRRLAAGGLQVMLFLFHSLIKTFIYASVSVTGKDTLE